MRRLVLLSAAIVLGCFSLQAQKKSELISQNQELKFQLDSVKGVISDAKRGEKIGLLKADELQTQVTELQDANATLMKNLNSFATLSSQNTENINKTLATIGRKEAQLKSIIGGFASADSTALVVLTNAKKTLGENAKVQVSEGVVVISEKLDFFFTDGLGTTLLESSKELLGKVSELLNANPKAVITVVGMNITGELNIALNQAATVSNELIATYAVDGSRIYAHGQDGGFKEGIQIRIHPDYKAFYAKAKEGIKNQ
ncbi:MAG: tetrahydromethanopterin S-methyltransferase subunit B [Maribacter sp.]|jgi:tetrahydromethanopterin S-methyltransferase subunit B